MSTVITVENLGKKYTLHHQQREQYTALRDVLANGVRNFSKKIFSPFTPHHSPLTDTEDFWALKDVSFEVKQGDRIGIIGRNGAGKSTLLKILSRITEPTTGSVRIKGRVASLLEVGTGFHPELTGRENIFLNGAILGMGRVEIKKKFDEIVDFAEIEKFLDTPVKRYSSGMYVRLAFAVAAHLEPEILIVDEVLAVGDAQFQKKCLGKMGDVSAKEGRTVLFVSHNMAAISSLTTSGLLLDSGRSLYYGNTREAVSQYEEHIIAATRSTAFVPRGRTGSGCSTILNVLLLGKDGKLTDAVEFHAPFQICIHYQTEVTKGIVVGFTVVTSSGCEILTSHSNDVTPIEIEKQGTMVCSVDPNCLAPGKYYLRVAIFDAVFNMLDRIEQSIDFDVTINDGSFLSMVDARPGAVKIPLAWSSKK